MDNTTDFLKYSYVYMRLNNLCQHAIDEAAMQIFIEVKKALEDDNKLVINKINQWNPYGTDENAENTLFGIRSSRLSNRDLINFDLDGSDYYQEEWRKKSEAQELLRETRTDLIDSLVGIPQVFAVSPHKVAYDAVTLKDFAFGVANRDYSFLEDVLNDNETGTHYNSDGIPSLYPIIKTKEVNKDDKTLPSTANIFMWDEQKLNEDTNEFITQTKEIPFPLTLKFLLGCLREDDNDYSFVDFMHEKLPNIDWEETVNASKDEEINKNIRKMRKLFDDNRLRGNVEYFAYHRILLSYTLEMYEAFKKEVFDDTVGNEEADNGLCFPQLIQSVREATVKYDKTIEADENILKRFEYAKKTYDIENILNRINHLPNAIEALSLDMKELTEALTFDIKYN